MFETQIARGVMFLDKEQGRDWIKCIRIEQLHMQSACNCVLGQLFGDFMNRLDINSRGEIFGFYLPIERENEYASLTQEWRDKIFQLRKERGYA